MIRIRIKKREFLVPEGQKVLRIFQHLRKHFLLDVGRFCWNQECQTCSFSFTDPQGKQRTALACQRIATEGMEILTTPWPIKEIEDGNEEC
jgi:predicted molibdopterin-dependent oxidoreductase YjgC